MGGGHLFQVRFDCGGIALILGKEVKVTQVAAGSVEEKAEDLQEELGDSVRTKPDRTGRS